MSIKLKSLAAAMALLLGVQANAAIDSDNASNATTGTGAGELFLSVIDRGGSAPRSYVLDLGITAADFLANDASYLNTLSFAADANLLDLLNNSNGTIAWNIAASHNTLGPTNDDLGYLTTSPTTLVANTNTPQGFNGLADSIGRIGIYLNSVNGVDANYAADGSQIFGAAANAFYDTSWGDAWNTSHSTETALDGSLGFYFVALDYTNDPSTNSSRVQTLLGEWSLSSLGLLTYGAETTSPVPLPAAVWLFGSGLLGMASIGRRKRKTA